MRTIVTPSTYMEKNPNSVNVNQTTDHTLRISVPLQAGPLCYRIKQIVIIVGGVC
jgi:hypothetical protein